MKKTLKLFKFYTTKIRCILVNAFKRKLKNVISMKICIFQGRNQRKQEALFIKEVDKKNRDVLNSSLFPNLTKSILYEKTLKLFKFYASKLQRILVNSYKWKLKNVICRN